MAWLTTKDGRRVNTEWFDEDEKQKYKQIEKNQKQAKNARLAEHITSSVISKHSGDEITESIALNSWAKNPAGIRAASQGEIHTGKLFEKVGLNDEAKAEVISNFVKGHSIKKTIYRGIQNLSQEVYDKYTKIGATITEKGLSSWSTDKGIAVGHGKLGNSITFVKTGSQNARSLSNKTGTDIEKEVILLDTETKVKRIKNDKYTTFVYLE